MKCPRCQHENPSEATFCVECGARWVRVCARCQTELPTGATFCLQCGEPVALQTSVPLFSTPVAYTPNDRR
jgi:ribosomal protein L40E